MREKIDREILEAVAKRDYQPACLEELAERLGVRKRQLGEFRKAINQLHRDGRLLIGEDKTIRLSQKPGSIIGTYSSHGKGFGFVIPLEPGETEDLFIPAEASKGAVTGDLVQASLGYRRHKGKVRLYGKIDKILTRGKNRFLGTLFRAANHWIVETDGKVLHRPIIVSDVSAKQARTGDRVIVKITEYPVGHKMPRGVIEKVLGEQGRPEVELQAVIEEFSLPEEFPSSVDRELDKVIDKFNSKILSEISSGRIFKHREDLRDKTIITIDPIDARDFDDAFHIDLLDDGYELGVHIADVSTFVKEGKCIDNEARERGNSVYLPGRVIPMIPEALSNGLCSLQEGQDRLTKSVFIRYDFSGNVISSRFANTIIRSAKRLTYEQASKAISGGKIGVKKDIAELLKFAEHLAKLIFARRYKAGMIHLDLPEVELKFNERGEVVDAYPADTSFSHTIIEMFMVEANEAVARLLDSYNVPFLRRIHPEPDPKAIEHLSEFLTLIGYKIPKDADRKDLQRLLKKVEGRPESFAVNYAILRTLKPAEYSPKSIGHYALASEYYCHFTSPIRRYPDLTIHRLLELHLTGKLRKLASQLREKQAELVNLGEHCSFTERRAEQAERQVKETLILELLSGHIGDEYDGLVTGISSLGPFVQISKYMIEGLIPLSDLGADRWEIDQDRGVIFGLNTHTKIKIGDPIRVRIVSVDIISRRLNLAPVDKSESGKKRTNSKKSKNGFKRQKERKSSAKRKGKKQSKVRKEKRRH